jgi:predicted dehydrogenase
MRVRLKSGYQVREPVPSYVIHGRKGSFLKSRADVQEALLLQNISPTGSDWGIEPEAEQGLLCTEKDGLLIRERIPSLPGNYYLYYDGIYKAMREGGSLPVTAQDGVNVMRIIASVFASHATGKRIDLSHA